jgi:hypothetical protein
MRYTCRGEVFWLPRGKSGSPKRVICDMKENKLLWITSSSKRTALVGLKESNVADNSPQAAACEGELVHAGTARRPEHGLQIEGPGNSARSQGVGR